MLMEALSMLAVTGVMVAVLFAFDHWRHRDFYHASKAHHRLFEEWGLRQAALRERMQTESMTDALWEEWQELHTRVQREAAPLQAIIFRDRR